MSLMSKKMVNGAVALGCMLFAAPVMAHEALNEYVLDPMMVTAARYEKRDVDIPAATEIYDQQKIEKLGANNVMEVVKNIPGFTLTASPTGNTYIGFRGIAKDNVAILVNGIPLNQDGNYDLESISADIIDRIEVVKGGATVLYGSNASAGVINIITNKKAAKNKVLIGFGDKNKFKGAVNVATDKLQLSYSRQQSKDRGFVYKNSGSNYYTGDKLEKDSLNLQYAISDNLSLQYMYSKKVSDCSKSVNGVYKPGFHSDIKYNFGQLRYVNDDLQATVFFRNRDWKFNTSTHQKGHNYGADLQDKFKLGNTMLTVGANYENENTKNSNNIEAAKRDSAAVFFMTETEVSDKTKIFLGAREAYVEKSGSKFCPQFQVMHSLGTDDNIYLNVNRSMRAPHVNEQWGTSTQLMNPDLKAENGWNYEFGWKKKLAADELFKVNLYHMDINDRIYSQRNYNGSGKSMFLNANKYRNTGVEVSYEKAASEKFSYNVGVSYGNPEQKLAKGDWQRVDFKLGLHAGVGYNLGKTNANIYANYMAERINGVKPMLDLTLNVKQQITKNDALRFAVYNLLDRDDIRTGSSSGTGAMLEERNWMLSYEHSF